MPFIRNGQTISLSVPAGQKIAVSAEKGSTVNVVIPAGRPGGPVQQFSDSQRTFGPFHANQATTVSLAAVLGVVEYAVGASPVLTSYVTAPFDDKSGTPGNVTSTSQRGRAAFAAAGASVQVTNPLVTASSTVLAQLGGTDATLKSIRCTPAAGSFTVTGDAAATATTKFDWLIVN